LAIVFPMMLLPTLSSLFPYTTLFRSWRARSLQLARGDTPEALQLYTPLAAERDFYGFLAADRIGRPYRIGHQPLQIDPQVLQRRSEEHTSELQSRENLVCRLLLEKKT